MKQISSIEELDTLLATHVAKGYFTRLNYALIPPRKPVPGEDGEPPVNLSAGPQEPLQKTDLYYVNNLVRQLFTVVAFHSRD